MKPQISKKEIVSRLMWFHGEDFEKYPLDDESFGRPTKNSSKHK